MTFGSLQKWLDEAAKLPSSPDFDVRLDRLSPSEREDLAAHLTDLSEAAACVLEAIAELVMSQPSTESLDSMLCDLENGMGHGVVHWRYLSSLINDWSERDRQPRAANQ